MSRAGIPRYRLNGRTVRLCDLAKLAGISEATAWARLQRGWTPEQVAATPRVPVRRRAKTRLDVTTPGACPWQTQDDIDDRLERRRLHALARRGDPEGLDFFRRMRCSWLTVEGVVV